MSQKIEQILELLKKEFIGSKSTPTRADPLDVLIATMLSQNTTDKTSYIAFQNLKKRFGSWNEVLNAPLIRIKNAIKVCGLASQKAKNIKKLLRALNKKYGRLSLDFIDKLENEQIYNELLQYNGIGVKTVSCVLAFGLGRDVFPVDTHVHRLCNRLGLVHTRSAEKTFEEMNRLVPAGKKFSLHTLLIKFGRKVCRANNPLCGKCILYDICEFRDKEKYAERLKAEPKANNFIILEHV